MKQNFTKKDLKDGMVVEQRSGWKGMVFGDRVLSTHGFNRLEGYSNTLEWGDMKYYSICRVYAPKEYGCGIKKYVDFIEYDKGDEFELIWERKEKEIKLTTEERAFLNSILLVSDYKYIARDKKLDALWVFKAKPSKGFFSSEWTYSPGDHHGADITDKTKGMFEFITWEDDEPYLIEDLLKGDIK